MIPYTDLKSALNAVAEIADACDDLDSAYRDLDMIDFSKDARMRSDPLGGKTKMAVVWNKDVDAAMAEAKAENKPLLVDFSAAPA
jgi:hypothetical protein